MKNHYYCSKSQGAVIAPLISNLFISDYPTTLLTITADFADGKAILASHPDPVAGSNLLQRYLNLLELWYKDCGIKINQSKS